MNNAQRINQTSGAVEYYTPSNIIEAARSTMGGIDLDPASSWAANKTVKAGRFYTVEDNGLALPWFGNVWLNHPFGRVQNPLWINKLVSEYADQNIWQACAITYACTSEKWFAPLFAYPMCFLQPRTNYLLPDGTVYKGVTKGSVVTYLGPYVERFIQSFSNLGSIMLPVRGD